MIAKLFVAVLVLFLFGAVSIGLEQELGMAGNEAIAASVYAFGLWFLAWMLPPLRWLCILAPLAWAAWLGYNNGVGPETAIAAAILSATIFVVLMLVRWLFSRPPEPRR